MDSSRQGPGKPPVPPGPAKPPKPPQPLKPLIIVPPYEPKKRGGTYLFIVFLFVAAAGAYYYYYKRDSVKTFSPEVLQAEPVKVEAGAAFIIEEGGLPERAAASRSASDTAYAAAFHAYNGGDYAKAAGLLRDVLRQEPDSQDVKAAFAKSLNRLALDRYNAGDISQAKSLLMEAADTAADDSIIENLANIHINEKDYRSAALLIERSSSPKVRKPLFNLYSRLGQEYYSKGEVEAALQYYYQANRINPNDPTVNAYISMLRRDNSFESGTSMGTSDNRHFLVKYEGGENAVAGHLIGLVLEEAYEKVGADLSFYPEDRIQAVLYTRENFRRVTRSPAWAGALFDGRIKVPAGGVTEKTELLEEVIFHEYTHAIVRRLSGGKAPVWLNEGIAQYEEGRTSAEYNELLNKMALSGAISLRRLEGSFMGLNSQQAEIAYLLSLSATEYIIREFGVFTVRRILENLGSGMSLEEAISSATYLSYADLEKSWLEYLK